MYPLTKQGEQKGLAPPQYAQLRVLTKSPPCVLHSKSIAFSRTPKAPDSV